MTWLLDVNALIALLRREHEFHARMRVWFLEESRRNGFRIATCAITELGAVRILPQLPDALCTPAEVAALLVRWKRSLGPRHVFLSDALGAEALPKWVKTPRQTTDGHLAALAKVHGAALATLDGKIPGVSVIAARA